jgi:hypothetical protein
MENFASILKMCPAMRPGGGGIEMERKKLTKKMYLECLQKDSETEKLICRNDPKAMNGLNTPEKRACFRVGYDAGFETITGTFSNPDTDQEKFHGWRALHPAQATENDAFFATCGASLSERWI